MEYIIELLLELVLEGMMEASKRDRLPQGLRYLLITLLSLFFVGIIGILFFIGRITIEDNIIVGLFFLLLGLSFLIVSILKFKNVYFRKKNVIHKSNR